MSMRKDWNGLLKILEIEHLDSAGNVIWSDKNLYNVFHSEGEEFVLRAVFVGGVANTIIPVNYYFGLDNRTTPAIADTMLSLTSEPSTNGYGRIAVSSTNTFTVALTGSNFRADGPIVTFSASGGSWGPVKNLFLTDQIDGSGFLIASVPLSQTLILDTGEVVNMRMGLSLKDCP